MARLMLPKKRYMSVNASAWKRLAAFFIDLLILDFVVSYPFNRIFQQIAPPLASFAEIRNLVASSPEITRFILISSVPIGLLSLAYFSIMEYKLSQTIGKMVMNLHIEPEGKRLMLSQCIMRNILKIPVFPLVFLMVLDFIWILRTRGQRRLSDILSKTKVVEVYSLE